MAGAGITVVPDFADPEGEVAAAPSANAGVKSAARVVAIIGLLTREPRGAGFGDICGRLELPKSSTHALLRTLTNQGFLLLDPTTRRYKIGVRLWEAGQAYLQEFDLPNISSPYMEAARDSLNETVQLAVLDGLDNVYVAKVEADQRLALQSRVGARLPAYSTGFGKVLLAGLSDNEVRERFKDVKLEPFTATTITDIEVLIAALDAVRERGFGTDNGEYTPGVICVAVPLYEHSGQVVAAMGVSVPEVRSSSESLARSLEVLLRQARYISSKLGHRETGSA